jgi:hypothetical protein
MESRPRSAGVVDGPIAQKMAQRELQQAACHTASHVPFFFFFFPPKVPGVLVAQKNSSAKKISGDSLHFMSLRVLQV